ncbi:MAG: SDR family NAD(P)-dependent oxidoreductase [Bacillota bacterium]
MSLKGKVAIITGGATGIGKATALSLAKQGVTVVINYSRSGREAEDTLKEVEAAGGQGMIWQADVADDEKIREMVKAVAEKYGRLDILVNSAGTTNFVPLEDLEGLLEEYWDRAMAVNVKGVFFCCRAAAPYLKESKGCVINVSSRAGFTGVGSSMAYAASKGAAITLTKSLARALAPEIRVNAVAPGIVMTRWVEGREDHIKRGSKDVPLGRACEPEDVSEVIMSLITNAGMITGQTIVIDGGMYMR